MRFPDVFNHVRHAVGYVWRYELVVLVLLGVVVGGVWAFGALAGEVKEGDTRTVDVWILKSLRTGPKLHNTWGPPWMKTAALDVTALGGYTLTGLILLLTAVLLGLLGRYGRMSYVLVTVIGGVGITRGLKELMARPRPTVVPHLTAVHSMSFPSGHAMTSAVVYFTLAVLLARMTGRTRLKTFFLAAALVLTGLVGCSRVYLGVHYPSDVLAGWLAGLAWASLAWLAAYLLGRWRQGRATETSPPRRPRPCKHGGQTSG